MKGKFFLLLAPLMSFNSLFIFLNGCGHKCESSRCGYYTNANLIAMDNADSTAHTPDAAGVQARAFLLILTLNDTVYKCVHKTCTYTGNSAWAECLGGTRLQSIDSIKLTSNHDFDGTHPAGADLKDVFNMNDTMYVHTGRNDLYLLKEPTDTGTHTFTITLYTHDTTGIKNLAASSLPVKLLL